MEPYSEPTQPIFAKCPHCGIEKKLMTNEPFSTCGLRTWTDSYECFPDCPGIAFVQKCPHCGDYFMMSEAEVRGPQNPEEWDVCLNIGRLSYPELKKAFAKLEQKAINTNASDEYYLRQELLFSFNDAFRSLDEKSREDIEGEPDNMERTESDWAFNRANIDSLISLIPSETNEDKVIVSELLREMGCFTECLATLKDIDTSQPLRMPYASKLIDVIRERAESNDDKVAELDISDEKIMIVM